MLAAMESPPEETRLQQVRRHAHRGWLYTWVGLVLAAAIILIALIVANTHRVELDFLVGTTRASLVWIIIVAALLGWLGGIATSVLFRRRTRRPR